MLSKFIKKSGQAVVLMSVSGLAIASGNMGDHSHDHGAAMKNHSHEHMTDSKGKRKKLSAETKKSVIAVLEANEQLFDSFFNYDEKKMASAAANVSKKIDQINDKEIKKLLTFAKTKLSDLQKMNDRKSHNQNYHLVSMALIHVINSYDVGETYNGYSCPMVKMKWVQNSKKISKVHNPYAPEMKHCGGVETFY